MDKVDEFLINWSKEKKIGEKTVDELFKMDNFPLWWFFDRTFVSHILPRQINTFYELEKKKKLGFLKKMKLAANAAILKEILFFNEKRKINYFHPKKEKSTENKVLFFSYTNHLLPNGSLFRIQKIIEKVEEDHALKPFVLFADSLSSRDYKKLKNFHTIYDYYDLELGQKAKKMAKELEQSWAKINQETKFFLLQKGDFSYWPYLKYAFNVFYSKKFLYLLILYYEMSKKALLIEKVKVVVLTSQNSIFDKCLIAAAEKLKVPLLRLQHGIGEGLNPKSSVDNYYKLVFSDFVKEELMILGWTEEKIIVTGPIIFDDIFQYISSPEAGRTILLATAPLITELGKKEYFQIIENILSAIKKVNFNKLIIKLHPAEIPSKKFNHNYWRSVKRAGIKNVNIFGADLSQKQFYQLIKESTVFLNFGSTSALEAMIIGRPVVTIELVDFPAMYNWMKENGLASVVGPGNEIISAIEKALTKKKDDINIKNYIFKKCGNLDGKAYERVVDIITKFAGPS